MGRNTLEKLNWAKHNPEKMKQLRKDWLEKNKDHRKDYMKKYNRNRKLKSYGLTQKDYNELLERQNNKCAICKTETPNYKGWCIDHCHTTGLVRGLLCDDCNRGLVCFKDNTSILIEAINYVRSNNY